MILSAIKNIPIVKKAYLAFGKTWVIRKTAPIIPWIPSGKCLDIGSGNGLVAQHISKNTDTQVTALDVGDFSILPEVKTVVYDGDKMPFPQGAFGAGLLLTVLHHTHSPEGVLEEATRVCERIIIIEDIYNNPIQQYATYAIDTLVNLGFSKMTYQNKSDREWKMTFQELGLQLIHSEQRRVLLFFRQGIYVLEKQKDHY